MKQKAVMLNSRDNVATVLVELKAGDILELEVGGEARTVKLTADLTPENQSSYNSGLRTKRWKLMFRRVCTRIINRTKGSGNPHHSGSDYGEANRKEC